MSVRTAKGRERIPQENTSVGAAEDKGGAAGWMGWRGLETTGSFAIPTLSHAQVSGSVPTTWLSFPSFCHQRARNPVSMAWCCQGPLPSCFCWKDFSQHSPRYRDAPCWLGDGTESGVHLERLRSGVAAISPCVLGTHARALPAAG